MEKRFFNALFVKGALFSALVAFFCAALLTCSNSAGGSDAPVSQKDSPLISSRPGYVILNGTVSASGAVPKILSDNYDSSSDNDGVSRSAQPGLDVSGDSASMEYFATATCGNDVVNGTFGSGSEAKKFGIELAASKTWSVVVGVRSKTPDAEGNRKIYLQSKPWSVTPDPADPTISRNFVPVPNTSGGEGKIELNVNCSASSNSLRVKFISGPDGVDLSAINVAVTNNTGNTGKIIKVENVHSGVYELCLDFLTLPPGNMLEYSSLQTVTVADGMTTNAWVDDANESALSPISGGEFKFNNDNKNDLTAAFLGTTVFVGKVSSDSAEPDDSNSGNFLSPLKTITRAAERINAVGNGGLDYYIRVSGEVSGLSSKSAAVIQTLAAEKAKSLTIIGTSGPDTDCIKSVTYQHSALNVTTPVPIKLKNIKIVGATGEGQGDAVSAWGSANVIIEDSVEITGADVGVSVSDSASVTMKGGTIAGNGVAVDMKAGSFVVQGGSIPYDSANKKNYVKTASEKFVTAKGDLAAVDASGGKIAIEPAQKKRGVKLVDVSATTASDADIEAKFMVYDPTISAENPSGDEWQLVSAAADRTLKTNAPIYVGQTPDGHAGSNDNPGTKSAPYYEIKRACEDMDDADMPYTINVRGKLPAQTIPNKLSKESTSIFNKAKSVLIKGVNPIPTSGENAGIPQDAIDGGGIYCANGRLTIKGGKISANEITGSSGNRGGIGLYAAGNSVIEMTGGEISGNKDTSHVDVVGGGVKLEGSASFKMSGGEVKDNQVVRAGGNFYVTGGGDSGPSVILSGSAKITGGVADSSSFSDQDAIGGAIWLEGAGSRLDMSGGEISGNSAKCSSSNNACAGIYVNVATFTMTGGKISDNNVLGGNSQGGALGVDGKFNISGSSYIPYGGAIGKNDVYLCDGKTVTIAGTLTPPEGVTKVAAITPSVFKRGTNILDGAAVLLSPNKDKFSVSQDDADWNKVGENIAGQYFVRINSPVYVVGAEGTGSTKPEGFGWGQTTGATGTKGHPFASVSAALSVLEAGAIDEITIAGLLKGAQAISGTFPSFTLKGYGGSSLAVINAGGASGAGSALTVDASGKTVTIQDLTITGGNADNGGGINLAAGTVKLADGAVITGNIASENGGGVYVGSSGTLFMYSSSLIGDSSTSTTIAADGSSPGSSSFANKAKLGGGIYNDGALYIGYSGMSGTNPVASAMTVTANSTAGYGIRRNLAEFGGGVYQNSSTDVQVSSGKISYNIATESGGAFYIAKKDSTTRTKVTFVQNSTAAMDSNKAAVSGGAVHIAGAFTIFSGNGHNNVAPQGGAIYLGQELNFGPYANFYDANNAKGVNDIYLEKSIWLSGKSNGGDVVASITMPDDKWIRGKGVLQSAEASYTAASAGKFKATDSDFTVVQKNSTSTMAVLSADIYVAGTASTRKHCLSTATPTDSATTRGTASSPFASIKGAMYAVNADATTITVDGTLSDAQTIDGKRLDDSSIPTAVTAITIKGYKASSTATSSGMLDGGSNSSNKTMLTVNKSGLAVTIQDLTITRGNAANGGGINLAAGTVNLESGAKVSSNNATSGGSGAGVYVASGATLNIKDGSAIFSNSEYSGTITGAGVYNSGTVNMSGGSVYSNTAYNGGAFYNGGTLSMTGGAIGGSGTLNSATNLGGAIYQAGTFNVSGDAFVYSGSEKSNDVYLASEKYITISANDLSSTTVATITPSSWVRGMQVLSATTDSWITSNYSRFKVSDAEWNVGYYVSGTATADYAKRIGADLWVTGTGYASGVCATKTASDSNRGTKKQPYASIKKAAEQCWTTGKAFTINISGMITGATQEIPAANSTAGTTLASKITLKGLTGNTKDGINRNLASSSAVAGGSALIINYQGYVDMTNLKIMGGNTTGNGGGIQINGPSTFSTTACPRVNLKTGVLIQQNKAAYGGGIYSSRAILCLSGTATVGNDGASDRSASNTAISNNINIATTAGGGIYKYNGYLYLGGAWEAGVINTSGYSLTKGVYANVCSYSGTDESGKNQAAGGIYNYGLFYMMSGNVSYNYGVNTGGVYSSSGSSVDFSMQGGKIHKNAGSGVYNAAGGNFCMSGDAVIGDVNTAASSSGACSNNKGGLVNYGTARLGYSYGTTKTKLSGGIYGNYLGLNAQNDGGAGIKNTGTLYFDSGTIAYNYLYNGQSSGTGGGGIFSSSTVYMTGASGQYACITNNKSSEAGGGLCLNGTSAKLLMSGYALIGKTGDAPPSATTTAGVNTASKGGGIAAFNGATICLGYSAFTSADSNTTSSLDNGGVYFNYATTNGGGIYCQGTNSSHIRVYIASGKINANKAYYSNGGTTNGHGGGIWANTYCDIYMGGGQISKNSAMNYGGGVYTAGALFMYGSALIGDTNTSTTTTTESNYSNCAKAGGGVYVTSTSGTLALGYDGRNGSDYFENTLTGGIKHNFATGETTSSTDLTTTTPVGIGGGVYMTGSYFYMKSGTIGYNKAYDGAGLAITHSVSYPTVYDGGSITYNSARRNGGGVAVHANSYVLIKGSVTYNTAAMNGGGFYLTEGDSEEYGTGLNLEGADGKISNNTATNGNGGGVCSAGGSLSITGGSEMASNYAGGNGGAVYGTRLQLNGVASIPGTSGHIGQTKYNDIYSSGITAIWLISSNLPAGTYFSDMYITLPSGLSSSDITNYRIVAYSYTAPDPGMASYSKFHLTQSSPYYTTKKIGEYGYLVNK